MKEITMVPIEERISSIRQEREEARVAEAKRREIEEREYELRRKEIIALIQETGRPYLEKLEELGIPEILEELKSFEQKERRPNLPPVASRTIGKRPKSTIGMRWNVKIISPCHPEGRRYNFKVTQRRKMFRRHEIWTENSRFLDEAHFDNKDLEIHIKSVSIFFSWFIPSSYVDVTYWGVHRKWFWSGRNICFTLSKSREDRWFITLNDKPLDQLDREFLEERVINEYEAKDNWDIPQSYLR